MDLTRFEGRHAFLSNFYDNPQKGLDGTIYPSLEHAFQAMKTRDRHVREYIRRSITPAEAKRRGRDVRLRANWEDIKVPVMYELLKIKFSDPQLRFRLVETGLYERLIEGNWWGDTFWGAVSGEHVKTGNGPVYGTVGWYGHNTLGRLLMRVRAEAAGGGCTCPDRDQDLPADQHPLECPLKPIVLRRGLIRA